ncbi:hypothetical protein [Curtobacterium sp. VKM Ac-1376]|uniref:hypothetical protein n=1 Tax=Curtobacterium sp. VKM Ac-1376 TaxID=123312 RepID=UPI00188AF18A|nr:hypothetical protein [Curtobacterium sp. VKM Ac-1376]MBF4613287.1 hypothetical protein [Curtobacterium sp. VKM Ac-1376]
MTTTGWSSGRSVAETVRWTVVDPHRWEARVGGVVVGNVASSLGYAVEYAVVTTLGEITGSHTSLENAKAQLEGWARWRVRLPWPS